MIIDFMPSKHNYLPLLLIFTLFFPGWISAQSSKKAEPMVLKHADELQSNLDEENQIISLFGRVWFKQGKMDLRSQRAVWYKKSGLVIFMGEVNITDVEYDLRADKVTYYQNSKRAVAEGKGDLKATCSRAIFYHQENKIILSENPQVIQKESQISGSQMALFLKDNKLEQIEVEQAQALYKNVKDTLKNTQEENLLSGKKMVFSLKDEQIAEIKVIGNAQSLYSPATEDTSRIPKNLDSGDTVQIFLSNGG